LQARTLDMQLMPIEVNQQKTRSAGLLLPSIVEQRFQR